MEEPLIVGMIKPMVVEGNEPDLPKFRYTHVCKAKDCEVRWNADQKVSPCWACGIENALK